PAPTSQTVTTAAPPQPSRRRSRAAPRSPAGSPSPTAAARAAPRRARRGAAGRHGDRDRSFAMDRRQDERAELGIVGDVAEAAELVAVRTDEPVELAIGGAGDHEPVAARVPRPVAVARRHESARRLEAARLLLGDRTAADDEAAPPAQVQARDVVRRSGHQTPTVWTRAPAP